MLFLILCSNSIFNINVDWLGGGDKNQNDLTCLLASLAWFSLKSTSTWTQTSLSLLGSQNLGYFRWLKGLFLVGIPSLGHLGHFIRCQRVHLHFQGFFFLICYHHCLCGLQVHKEGYKFPCRTMFHLAFGHSPHEIMPPLADVTSSHATWSIISLVTLLVISCNTSFISTSCCPLRNILQTFFSPFLWWQAWVCQKVLWPLLLPSSTHHYWWQYPQLWIWWKYYIFLWIRITFFFGFHKCPRMQLVPLPIDSYKVTRYYL